MDSRDDVKLDRRAIVLSMLGSALVAGCGGGGGDSAGSFVPPPPPAPPPPPPSGSMTLLAGALGGTGNADGIGSQARLNSIGYTVLGPVFDSDLNAYVMDGFQFRRIAPTGEVTTLTDIKGSVASRGLAVMSQ